MQARGKSINEIFKMINQRKNLTSFIQEFKSQNRNLDEQGENANTLLIFVAEKGHVEFVKSLLAEGVNVNHSNAFGDTALHWATTNGHINCVKILIAHKANVNVQNAIHQETALMHAANKGYIESVQLFLDQAKLDIANSQGLTALDIAIKNNHLSIIKLLLKHGATIRDPQALYPLLINANDDDTLSSLLLLYQHQNIARTIGDNQLKLNEDHYQHLAKIFKYHTIHSKNIFQAIDKATNKEMPLVLLDIITQYIESSDIKLKGKTFSFFKPNEIDRLLSKEVRIEKSLQRESHKTPRDHKKNTLPKHDYNFRPSTLHKRRH